MSGSDLVGLLGIPGGLALLIWFAFRGWSVLLLLAAVVAALLAQEPLLAHLTQTFVRSAAGFFAAPQGSSPFFLLFLLGALFGKLMDTPQRCKRSVRHRTRPPARPRCLVPAFDRSDLG